MTLGLMTLPESSRAALASLVLELTGRELESVEAMPGGASTRSYFRINRGGRTWAVAMYVPDASQSDEIAKGEGSRGMWPFVEVHRLLDTAGIAVPRILGEAREAGLLLLEDLGDATLANYLHLRSTEREQLYTQAVRDLARAQLVLRARLAGTIVGRRRFDYDLLRWEVQHFREWALESRGHSLGAVELEEFETAADYLAHTISALPYGFVHRDYQSRNLMVRELPGGSRELVWIDFQDALLGPRTYDLVALLGDSYQAFTPEFVDRRLEEYAEISGIPADDRSGLRTEFLMVMVQRKLKDAGRFVYLDRVKGKSGFLPFVESTIEKALMALERLPAVPELGPLEPLLRRALHQPHR